MAVADLIPHCGPGGVVFGVGVALGSGLGGRDVFLFLRFGGFPIYGHVPFVEWVLASVGGR